MQQAEHFCFFDKFIFFQNKDITPPYLFLVNLDSELTVVCSGHVLPPHFCHFKLST